MMTDNVANNLKNELETSNVNQGSGLSQFYSVEKTIKKSEE